MDFIIKKYETEFLELVADLRNGNFYVALDKLVDLIDDRKEHTKILAATAIFIYNFNKIDTEFVLYTMPNEEYSTMRDRFNLPLEDLFKSIPDESFRKYLLKTCEGIRQYCIEEYVEARKLFHELIDLDPNIELAHYYLCAIYTRERNNKLFTSHFHNLSNFTQKQAFSSKYEKYRPDFSIDPLFMILEFNKEILALTESKSQMVKRYSHNWSNLLFPETVLGVAETLIKYEAFQQEAKMLMRTYNNEKLLEQQSTMLELRHSSNTEKVKEYIKKGRLSLRSTEDGWYLRNIIDEGIERVLFKTLLSNKSRPVYIRDKMKKEKLNIEWIRESFEKKFFSGDKKWLEWLEQYLITLKVDIGNGWGEIKLKKDSGAVALLDEIITELLTNVFTYGSKYKGSIVDLEFYRDHDFLIIKMTNDIDKNCSYTTGTKQGLSSLESLLKIINEDPSRLCKKFIEDKIEDGKFIINVYIRKELLLKKERGTV
ncbi:hypothetical protein [Priestia megaterium]|uniref:hypothetical protein n=1 Tax=Priestia megaterium TaxID=1404 RepID=UPI0020408A27|nr:hypothetical protein [Priestia megaterium]MCM3541757.1 hypothetical protein [Priestia megaterium]